MPYLFQRTRTINVKRSLTHIFWRDGWQDAGQGWEGRAGDRTRTGWHAARRIIALRRPLIGDVLLADDAHQLGLALLAPDGPAKRDEYAVLVPDLPDDVPALAQRYRARADSENTFDELKNQWGWGGDTTQELTRSRVAAMTVALSYPWWAVFVRLAHPKGRLEAITSRPVLWSGIAHKTTPAGPHHLKITSMHGNGGQAKALLTRVRQLLQEWTHLAEQLNPLSVWQQACQFLAAAVTGFNGLGSPQTTNLLTEGTG